MIETEILLPSAPRIVSEDALAGTYEIDGLYPGYGHTLGNSLRRIILSSLPGAAITSVKIDGVPHEFSVIDGVKQDVITLLLNLKKVRFKMLNDEPMEISLSVKGPKSVTAKDIKAPSQVEILNPEQSLFDITGNVSVSLSMRVEMGLGFASRDELEKEKLESGSIVLDAIFTPVRRVNYDVENMRVGDQTDHNRLRMFIETDGSLSPREALERSINIMIRQLQAITGFAPETTMDADMENSGKKGREKKGKGEKNNNEEEIGGKREKEDAVDADILKIRIESLNLASRTTNALNTANIRTVGGLARKTEEDLLDVDGLGEKGIVEIKKALINLGLSLRK